MRKCSSVKSLQENTTGKYWEVFYKIDIGSHVSVFCPNQNFAEKSKAEYI